MVIFSGETERKKHQDNQGRRRVRITPKRRKRMVETQEAREVREARNKKRRTTHWRRTGVGNDLIAWMDHYNWL